MTPNRGPLNGIADASVRDELRKLWETVEKRNGLIGEKGGRYVTKAELAQVQREIAAAQQKRRGYRATTIPEGGAGAPGEAAPSGPPAPTDAAYVLMDHNAALPQHRRLQAGSQVELVDGGPGGNATLRINMASVIGASALRHAMAAKFASNLQQGVGYSWPGSTGNIAAPTATRLGQIIRDSTATSAAVNTVSSAHGLHSGNIGFLWRGTGIGLGGFTTKQIFRWEAQASPTPKWYFGLQSRTGTALGSGSQPSGNIDCIQIGCDTGDVNVQLMHNDNVSICTKTDLGSDFQWTVGDLYILDLTSAGNDSAIDWRVTRVTDTDSYVVSGTASTNLPRAAIFMGPIRWMCNGGSGGVMQICHLFSSHAQPYDIITEGAL